MKRLITAIIIVLITFLVATFIVSTVILQGNKILTSFYIISVDNVSTNYNIKYEKVKAAKYYDIIVYNENNVVIHSETSYKTSAKLELTNLEYDTEYKMVVFAYDALGDSISVINPYTFHYTEPSFSLENKLVLKDKENYILKINGNLTKKNYYIKISEANRQLKVENLSNNEYVINHQLFNNDNNVIDIEIYDLNTVINKITLYKNTSPVSDLKITSPQNAKTLDYNDVILTYEGGNNATKYLVQIYNGSKLIIQKEVRKNRCVINSEIFKKAEEYRIVINASYEEYKEFNKTAEVTFLMNEKDTLKPVILNSYNKYVKAGTPLILINPNTSGNIYYTMNGDDPSVNGTKYTEPIIASENMRLKAVVMEPQKNNSIISDFEINVGIKANYSIYLSPSNQTGNLGVTSTGYTNEMKEMNDLANYIEKRLKKAGIKVYRNSSSGNINRWVSDSMYYGVDLHLALHSNASTDHNEYGVETWINEQSSKTYSLANLLQESIMSIYYSEEKIANRGVKYANGALGEVNDLWVPFGILLEVAHHDYEKDAAWIMENKELIGNNIADTILKYFGLI